MLGLTPRQFERAIRVHYQKHPERWYAQYVAQGKAIIYQQQFEEARKGSVTALKWLGIQHLGQRAHVETLFNPGDKTKEEEKPENVKGFAILTPEGMNATSGDVQAAKPNDEQPVVENLIKNEQDAPKEPQPASEQPIVEVSGFPEEHEASDNI